MREPMTFEIRQAGPSDVNAIAAAHLDSIRSIGPRYSDAETIDDWGSRVQGTLYANAMAAGESFYIALGRIGGKSEVLGFSSHRIDDNEHGTAVYVRGKAARLGIGWAVFGVAVSSARAAAATRLEIDESQGGVD